MAIADGHSQSHGKSQVDGDGDGDGHSQSHTTPGVVCTTIPPYTTFKIWVKTQLSPGPKWRKNVCITGKVKRVPTDDGGHQASYFRQTHVIYFDQCFWCCALINPCQNLLFSCFLYIFQKWQKLRQTSVLWLIPKWWSIQKFCSSTIGNY